MKLRVKALPQTNAVIIAIITAFVSLIMLLPIAALIFESIIEYLPLGIDNSFDTTFSDLADTVLLDYIFNSLSIVAGTLFFASVFAIAPAWWCSHYEFSGRKYLQWMMVFPLAIPAYISAYIYTDVFDYAGPIQSSLRAWFDWQSPQDYWFFDIRSRWGASLMLGLALYPYLFLLLRNAFEQSSSSLADAATLMGASKNKVFWTIQLPLARPAMAIGCTLIAMESLADYGTVQLFAINTLTTAIYDSWLVYGSIISAAKISCLTLLFILTFVWLEKSSRKRQQHFDARGLRPSEKTPLSPAKSLCVWGLCLTIFCLGFAYPVLTLLHYGQQYLAENLSANLMQHSQSTFMLAGIAASIATLIALLLNSQQRFHNKKSHRLKVTVASLGYAIPGTVLAIGILIPLTQLDLWINHAITALGYDKIGLILSGTSVALVMAFVIRFSAVSNGSIQSAYQTMPKNIDHASTLLKASALKTFIKIQLPLLTPAIITAFLLVFIECVKELPASLLLRPFDFETLATYVYQFASDEQLEHAASGALLIIIVSLLPILILSRTQKMN